MTQEQGSVQSGAARFSGSRTPFTRHRFFEGEDSETRFPADVRHCIRIYQELIALNHDLLERAEQTAKTLAPDARREILVTDIPALKERLRCLDGRLQFWYERLWALEGMDLDREERTVDYRGKQVVLTRREFDLIEHLLRHPQRYLTARQLIHGAWGERGIGEEQLRTYIVRLRKRIEELGLPCRLVNKPRRGYSLVF